MRANWFRLLPTAATCLLLEGALAGYSLLHPNNLGRCGHVANASSVLDRAFRGRGLGAQFFAWLRAEYGQSARRFRLELTPGNEGAARLYARLGFTPLDYRQMILDAD